MGKTLIHQARGKGSPRYTSPSFRFKGSVNHKRVMKDEETLSGTVQDIIHCQGHSAPLMKIKYQDNQEILQIACEGIRVGEEVHSGEKSPIKSGNVLPLKNIPEGTLIYNIELKPGDGGKLIRTSGTFGKVITKLSDKIIIILPSKKEKTLLPDCRAVIGKIAGGGRPDKPLYKAGNNYFKMRARKKLYPIISGTSQNSVDHPFGGTTSSHKGRPTVAPRFAPAGRNVGKISPRRTGRK
ncbi:MAG: 50S ribosomal protein L2 [Candidatus Woesearchaeota archaeon]